VEIGLISMPFKGAKEQEPFILCIGTVLG